MLSNSSPDPLLSKNKKKTPLSNTTHPYIPMYQDTSPSPQPIDQFAPYLTRKMNKKHTKVTKSDSIRKKSSQVSTSRLFLSTSASKLQLTKPNSETSVDPKKVNNISNQKSITNYILTNEYISQIDHLFDQIATDAADIALNQLVEENFKTFFEADNVYFYHDVSSVQLLFCPTNSMVVPHGSGLVGYTHFSRKIQNIPVVCQHVSYQDIYDSKHFEKNSHALIFPIFDKQNSIKAVVEIIRNPFKPFFSDSDEKSAGFLQNKFRLYSRYLFQPLISNHDLANLISIQRIPLFIESTEHKMTNLFKCRSFEIWTYHPNTNEIFLYSNKSNEPKLVQTAESGVAGYAMMNLCSTSLTNANLHSAYHPQSDGTGELSILAMPVRDQDTHIIYGLVLRGKRQPFFFTDTDEKILSQVASLIIQSLNSSELVEKSFKKMEESQRTAERLQSLLEVAETISGQLNIDILIASIMNKACDLVNADRCSLFMINENRDKLITSFQGGLKDAIEIPINSGIVGYTATTGEILNIKEAYEDPRFNRQTDLKTGYKTKNLLCVPIFDEKGKIQGVTEMINKLQGGFFEPNDEKLMTVFNVFVGISIENARLYRASIDLSLQLRSILEISQKISQTNTLKQLLENILKNARKVIGAGTSLVYMMDSTKSKFDVFATDEDVEVKTLRLQRMKENEKAQGKHNTKRTLIRSLMMGQEMKSISAKSMEDDERNAIVSQVIADHASRVENSDTNPEQSMIVAPIFDNDKSVLGATVMQWKRKNDKNNKGFTQEDLKLLESFSIFISISLERSRMLAIAEFGEMELELRNKIGDAERQTIETPSMLSLDKHEKKIIISRDFICNDFSKIDPGFMKIGFCLFDSLHIRRQFEITNEKLFSFIFSIRDSYHDIPLHDWTHAMDCSCALLSMVAQCKLLSIFNPSEILSLIIASFCNYAGHNTNQTNAKMISPLSILFNNQSVMETHHCSVTIDILSRDTCNILHALNKKESVHVWKNIIDLIFATDLSKHMELVKEARRIRESGEKWMKSEEERMVIIKLLLKACDFSFVAKKIEIADKWSDWLYEEHVAKGEFNKLGSVYETQLKKETMAKDAFLIEFYSTICLPLYEVLAQFFPALIVMHDQIKTNIGIIQRRIEEPNNQDS